MATRDMYQISESPDETKSAAVVKKDSFVGNVSKLAPLPKGQSGPAQKGQLVFDACFETGKSTFETPSGIGVASKL